MEILAEDTDWAGYHVSVEGSEAPPGGLLVLSRYPFAKIAYRKLPSAMGRYAPFATLDPGTETLVVATAHLESPLEDHTAREAQLPFVQARLPGRGLWVWLGDFNFGDQDPDTRLVSLVAEAPLGIGQGAGSANWEDQRASRRRHEQTLLPPVG